MNWGFDRFTTNWSTRVDAHILVAFLAYSLQVTLKRRLLIHAPGLTPAAVLEKLASIQMIDVHLPTVDRWPPINSASLYPAGHGREDPAR